MQIEARWNDPTRAALYEEATVALYETTVKPVVLLSLGPRIPHGLEFGVLVDVQNTVPVLSLERITVDITLLGPAGDTVSSLRPCSSWIP